MPRLREHAGGDNVTGNVAPPDSYPEALNGEPWLEITATNGQSEPNRRLRDAVLGTSATDMSLRTVWPRAHHSDLSRGFGENFDTTSHRCSY